MKKKAINKIMPLLLYALFGAAIGLFSYDIHTGSDINSSVLVLIFMLSLFLALFEQIIVHESGHLVFGLMTGYEFSSFNIMGLMLVKADGKLTLKRMRIQGMAGQCLLKAPQPDADGNIPYALYNLGGVLMNIIVSLLCLVLYFLSESIVMRTVLYMMFDVGMLFALTNGLPLQMGPVDNDGRNLLTISRSKSALRDFRIQMCIAEAQSENKRLKDMPDEWFNMPPDEELFNTMTASAAVFCCNRLMDECRLSEAYDAMRHLMSADSAVLGLYRSLMTCDCIFCELMGENRSEVIEQYMTAQQKKFMLSMKRFPGVIRTEYALALLHDGDRSRASKVKKDFQKCAASYPYRGDIESETELMAAAESITAAAP